MSTIEERLRALKAARAWMNKLMALPLPNPLTYRAHWYLGDYPTDASLDKRLADLEGYSLMLVVRRIERVRALIDEVQHDEGVEPNLEGLRRTARHLARHYPEPSELTPALRTPQATRAWAAFYLNRAPGTMRVLTPGDPPQSDGWTRSRSRSRRETLRCLPPALRRIDLDPKLPPLGVSEARQLLKLLPPKGELRNRLMGVDLPRFNAALAAIQRACQLLEAIVDGTFPASLRQQALAQRLLRSLPHSEAFPLTSVGEKQRQAWGLWLFAYAGGYRSQHDVSPDASVNHREAQT